MKETRRGDRAHRHERIDRVAHHPRGRHQPQATRTVSASPQCKYWSIAVALVFGLLVLMTGPARSPAPAAGAEGALVEDIPLPNGAFDRTLLLTPSGSPHAVLVMFAGGDGILHIGLNGEIGAPGNFLVRTRDLWVQQGFAVAIPDAPSNDAPGLQGRRLTSAYGDVISRVVAFAREHTHVPVWLVGTSAGTPAAASGAAGLPGGEIAGLVLTSSVTRPALDSPETVFQVDLKTITVPTLILSNTKDECHVSPPSDGARIKAALSHAKPAEFETVTGGSVPKSTNPCEAFAYHGFYGIEQEAVQKISDWITGHS